VECFEVLEIKKWDFGAFGIKR